MVIVMLKATIILMKDLIFSPNRQNHRPTVRGEREMHSIMLARIAYLLPFIKIIRRIGVSVDHELYREKLPNMLDDQPDAYIPVIQAVSFLRRMEHKEGIEDLGFLASQEVSYANLRSDFIAVSRSAPTLYARLQLFEKLVSRENTCCQVSMIADADDIRMAVNLVNCPNLRGLHYSEWIQIIILIEIVRKTAGTCWCPSEITFRSHFTPCQQAFELFPNTRFLFGQKNTSIKVPMFLLCQPPLDRPSYQRPVSPSTSMPQRAIDFGLNFPDSLKLLLQAYLREDCLSIQLAAEIAGVSVRTLQRRLAQFGLCYSALLEQARFESALELIRDTGIKLLDVAYALGYEDPSHFSRAFRRIAGMSPRKYRQQLHAGF